MNRYIYLTYKYITLFVVVFPRDTSSSEFTAFIQIFFFTTILEFFILVPFIQAVLKGSVFLSTCNNHENTGILTAFGKS
jgi:hypothetical protein